MAEVHIPVTKAKSTVAIDTATMPDVSFEEIVFRGLKDYINSGMSKFKTTGLEGEALEKVKAEIMAHAEENLRVLMAGEIKSSKAGKKALKVPTEVKNEALRLAKLAIKDQIKADGEKPSLYAASDITKWAKDLLEADPTYLDMAKESLERRKATPVKISLSGLKPSEKLVKAAAVKKAKDAEARKTKGGPISAKQAAMPAPRQKPQGGTRPTAH